MYRSEKDRTLSVRDHSCVDAELDMVWVTFEQRITEGCPIFCAHDRVSVRGALQNLFSTLITHSTHRA